MTYKRTARHGGCGAEPGPFRFGIPRNSHIPIREAILFDYFGFHLVRYLNMVRSVSSILAWRNP
jgi:hypothetical protein